MEVEGLTEVRVVDFKQASHWYAKGKRARTTSWTSVNEASSRSHWWVLELLLVLLLPAARSWVW